MTLCELQDKSDRKNDCTVVSRVICIVLSKWSTDLPHLSGYVLSCLLLPFFISKTKVELVLSWDKLLLTFQDRTRSLLVCTHILDILRSQTCYCFHYIIPCMKIIDNNNGLNTLFFFLQSLETHTLISLNKKPEKISLRNISLEND